MRGSLGIRASRLSRAIVVTLAAAALAPSASRANHSVFERVSAGAINGSGAFGAAYRGASADGKRVFFQTFEQLVSADTDARNDIYERSGGTTKRVSAGAINGNRAFDAGFAGTSADGARVFFVTREKLVSADTDASIDVYERSGGTTKRVSAGAIRGNGAFDAFFEGASADGTRVFFDTSEPLVGADTDANLDVYERSGGATKRVSTGAINGNGAFGAFFEGASAAGARVFFTTAEPLVGADTDASTDIYERSGGATKRVSTGAINGNGAFGAFFEGASADGTRVFFDTSEPLVGADTDASTDIYERSGGTTKRVSAGAINGNGAVNPFFGGASADGTRVFFDTSEPLVGADTDASTDIYERSGGTTKRVSAGAINGSGAFDAGFRSASANGTRVFFQTSEQLLGSDKDASRDVYERSGGTTKLVSAGPINGNGAFDPFFQGASADGTRVFFGTSEQLVSSDTDAGLDVYERFGGATTLVSRGVIAGNEGFDASFAGTSADGTRAFFDTFEQLVGGDEDANQDIYAARVP